MSLLQNDGKPGAIPYTFRIGVIGHRALKDPAAVKLAVDNTIKKIELMMKQVIINPNHYNNTVRSTWHRAENQVICYSKLFLASIGILRKETPPEQRTVLNWNLISSIAKGADQVVVKSGMKILGASLEVVLPFRSKDYQQDFDQYEDQKTFNLLFEKADSKLNYAFELEPAPAKRSEGYKKAGEMVVQSSEIILAVWDGMPARGEGGTAEMADYALSLKRPVIWINTNDLSSPVCLLSAITKPEAESININTKPFPCRAGELSQQFVDLVEYNRDPAFSKSGYAAIYNDYSDRLEKARIESGLSESLLAGRLKDTLSHFSRADYLASHYQKIHTRSAKWLYRLSTIAVIVAVVQALFFPFYTGLILFEILALLVALIWYRVGVIENWQRKWLNYRHLAERLRIMTFRCLLKPGSTRPENERVQSLPFYQGPGEWVLVVENHVQGLLTWPEGLEDRLHQVKNFILKGLIRGQAEYYASTAREKAKHTNREQRFIGFLLIITLLAAAFHLFDIGHSRSFENLIVTLVVVLPAIAASQHAIGSINDFERISSRSSRMEEILRRLEKLFEKAATFDELRKEIQNAEDILSTENHEWCVSLSFRRISLPV
jgi:hypothetical protein